jgi:hypothetical protein
MMDQNNLLQNNFNDNAEFDSYSQPMIQTEQPGYPDYFSTAEDSAFYTTSNYEQQPENSAFSFPNNGNAQPLSNAQQYADQNISSPFNPINTTIANSSQTAEVFRFEIPGFKIIIIPTSSSLANLDVQDYTYLNPTTSLVGQSQLNQEQSYASSVNRTTSGGSSTHHQQQNFNESFNNFSNLHD